MSFNYTEIERVTKLTKKEFIENYYKKQRPVVITNQIEDWPAFTKWNLDFIKEIAGDKTVPLYDSRKTDYTKKVNEPDFKMTMAEYIDILEKGPTDLRIFLYNLMKDAPSMKDDMRWPDLGIRLLKNLPLVFFGGENAKVFMHYDIDFPNIFHFHFDGKKQCVLVDPKETKYMYRLPYSWICHEEIDFDNPDFDRFPALKKGKSVHYAIATRRNAVYARRLVALHEVSNARILVKSTIVGRQTKKFVQRFKECSFQQILR